MTAMPKLHPFREEDLGKWIKQSAVRDLESTSTLAKGFPWAQARDPLTKATDSARVGDRSFRGAVPMANGEKQRFDATLDETARIARVSVTVGELPDTLYTIEYADFGLTTDITAPPASEVTTLNAFDVSMLGRL
jgi:hypothetical protein